MVSLDYASLFSRSPRTSACGPRRRDVAQPGQHHVQGQPLDHQALAGPPSQRPTTLSPASERAHANFLRQRFDRAAQPPASRCRCQHRSTHPVVERHPSRAFCQPQDDRACDCSAWLDTQKKTLRASERDEVARAAFREQISHRNAADFVIFDECGSNLNLTPLYARAPRTERAYGAIPRNTRAGTTWMASLSVNGI